MVDGWNLTAFELTSTGHSALGHMYLCSFCVCVYGTSLQNTWLRLWGKKQCTISGLLPLLDQASPNADFSKEEAHLVKAHTLSGKWKFRLCRKKKFTGLLLEKTPLLHLNRIFGKQSKVSAGCIYNTRREIRGEVRNVKVGWHWMSEFTCCCQQFTTSFGLRSMFCCIWLCLNSSIQSISY